MDRASHPEFVVKICGITTVEDGQEAAAAGADAIGLNFYPQSPRYITFSHATEIAAKLPVPVLRVGVFVNPAWEDLLRASREVPLDIVQIHGQIHGAAPAHSDRNLRVWRAFAVDDRFDAALLDAAGADAYLLDTPTTAFGGSGRTFDWSKVVAVDQPNSARVLVAGGLDASNVGGAIAALRPWGVDACSRLESRPGSKDARKLREFVEAARRAFEAIRGPVPAGISLRN